MIMMFAMISYLILTLQADALSQQKTYCQRGESCWPTDDDVDVLEKKLFIPEEHRILYWPGLPYPRISAVPIYSPGEQPIYGVGTISLDSVYNSSDFDPNKPCFNPEDPETRMFCLVATRNNPLEGWNPGFVIWALNPDHVQAAVLFAANHNLCIMVMSTGHDFLNRHSCSDGVMIRTTLMKNVEWDLDDRKGFGNVDGNVRFGPGIVFHEAHQSASVNKRQIASGWAITVGIGGWSMGGGHGPLGPSAGLGVDNILEVDIVVANGDLVTANSKNNTDLFWAIRGGGGSTWGVVTAFTLKAHKIPDGGITHATVSWSGGMCENGKNTLHELIDHHLKWSHGLDKRFSCLSFIVPAQANFIYCGGTWLFFMSCVFQGSEEEGEDIWRDLVDAIPDATENVTWYSNYWDYAETYALEPITPGPWTQSGVPSVLVSRDVVASGALAVQIKARIDDCITIGNCQSLQLYQAITGNTDSPQDPNVSIDIGFREAIFHFVFGGNWTETTMDSFYSLGENSYFSESEYTMKGDSWKQRYWGNNYQQLFEIKRKWDPENIFWCRHCVGSDI